MLQSPSSLDVNSDDNGLSSDNDDISILPPPYTGVHNIAVIHGDFVGETIHSSFVPDAGHGSDVELLTTFFCLWTFYLAEE